MTDNEDPLDVLFKDTRSVDDRKLLADLLAPYVEIVREGDLFEISLTALGRQKQASQRVLLHLLARKVLHLKSLIDDEGSTPSELEATSGIPGGTLRPKLSQLLGDNLVRKDPKGRYYVPAHRIPQVKETVEGDTSD